VVVVEAVAAAGAGADQANARMLWNQVNRAQASQDPQKQDPASRSRNSSQASRNKLLRRQRPRVRYPNP
jgi:hypothetical protein